MIRAKVIFQNYRTVTIECVCNFNFASFFLCTRSFSSFPILVLLFIFLYFSIVICSSVRPFSVNRCLCGFFPTASRWSFVRFFSLTFLCRIYVQIICCGQFYVLYAFFFLKLKVFLSFGSFIILRQESLRVLQKEARQTHAGFYYNFETFALSFEKKNCPMLADFGTDRKW